MIFKRIRFVLVALLAIQAAVAMAGAQVLGFEIGASSTEQVRAALAKNRVSVESSGTNKYSLGPMFKVPGNSFDVEGLKTVTFIFDDKNRLAATILDMANHRFDAINQFIGNKYKVVSQQIPFVGNKYVRYSAPDTVIEISAPHLSFDMEVSYIRSDLMDKFKAQSASEKAQKQSSEASKF